jgi:hypothetical protein
VAGRGLLIDGATLAELGDACAADALGAVMFKGKTAPVEVFAIGA